jgi:hypothetical protein
MEGGWRGDKGREGEWVGEREGGWVGGREGGWEGGRGGRGGEGGKGVRLATPIGPRRNSNRAKIAFSLSLPLPLPLPLPLAPSPSLSSSPSLPPSLSPSLSLSLHLSLPPSLPQERSGQERLCCGRPAGLERSREGRAALVRRTRRAESMNCQLSLSPETGPGPGSNGHGPRHCPCILSTTQASCRNCLLRPLQSAL